VQAIEHQPCEFINDNFLFNFFLPLQIRVSRLSVIVPSVLRNDGFIQHPEQKQLLVWANEEKLLLARLHDRDRRRLTAADLLQILSFQHALLVRTIAGVVIWHSPFSIFHSPMILTPKGKATIRLRWRISHHLKNR